MITDVFTAVSAHSGLAGVECVLGAEYREELSRPPRLVWVPSSDTFEPGKRINSPNSLPITNNPRLNDSVGTRWAGVKVLCWAETSDSTKTATADIAAAEDLVRRLLVAVHEKCFGSYRVLGMEWTGADGAELVQVGRACLVSLSFAIPIFKDAPTKQTVTVLTQVAEHVALPAWNATTLAAGLWSRWDFSRDSATKSYDRLGRIGAKDYITSGGYPAVITGPGGRAARQFSRVGQPDANALMGIRGDMDVPDYARFIEGEWTCSFWLRRETVQPVSGTLGTVWQMIGVPVSGQVAMACRVQLSYSSGNLSSVVQYRAGLAGPIVGATDVWTNPFVIGTWAHVIVRKTLPLGPTGLPTQDAWLNGVQLTRSTTNTTAANSQPSLWPAHPSARFSIGADWRQNAGVDVFQSALDGSLADLCFFNRGLSDSEIAAWYAAVGT